MSNASIGLSAVLADLSTAARRQRLSDSAWARLAGLPKESLSRLRRRSDCDWMTLDRLARALGLHLGALPTANDSLSADGHLPLALTREDEDRLRQLALSGDLDPSLWRAQGPTFFMAGFAVLLASSRDFDRPGLLDLAETLHPGMSEPAVFNLWLQRTPVEPSRWFAQLDAEQLHVSRR